MKRKVIRQRDSYTVTLPIKWVKEHGVDEGLEVDVHEEKEGIIIQTEGIARKKETELKITPSNEPFIRHNLNNLYRLGYDKIRIFYETKKQLGIVEKSTNMFLLGFEVTEIGDGYAIIENVAEPSGAKQEVLLRRMFLLVKQSMEKLSNDFTSKKIKGLQEIMQITEKVGQYDNFCRRNVTKRKFSEEKTNFYWGLYTYLRLIQQSMVHLYEALENKAVASGPSRMKFIKALQGGFDSIYNAFYKKDLETINRSKKEMANALKEIQKEIMKSKGIENIALYYLAEMTRLAYLATSPMIGILL